MRRNSACVRPRTSSGSVLEAKQDSELEDIMDEVAARSELPDEVDSATSVVATPARKAKRVSELDDVMSEVAARKVEPSWEDIKSKVARSTAGRKPIQEAVETDEEKIVPMHAGAVPLPPGKIAVNPMEGMDGEYERRCSLETAPLMRARDAKRPMCRSRERLATRRVARCPLRLLISPVDEFCGILGDTC